MELHSFNPVRQVARNIRRLHSNKLKRHLANPIIRTWKCRTINLPTFSPYVKMSDDRLLWIVHHSIMLKVTWWRFEQSAKQLVVGRTTIKYDGPRLEMSHSGCALVRHFQPGVQHIWMSHSLLCIICIMFGICYAGGTMDRFNNIRSYLHA